MPLTESQSKDALRVANDWLVASDPPGAPAAREGIANMIPLVMMGAVVPRDLDELASLVEENGEPARDADVPLETHRAQLKEAVRAAFEHVRSARS